MFVFIFAAFISSIPYDAIRSNSRLLAVSKGIDSLLNSWQEQATAGLREEAAALVERSNKATVVSKQIVEVLELELAETDPIVLASLKAKRKLLHAEYRRVSGLPPKP